MIFQEFEIYFSAQFYYLSFSSINSVKIRLADPLLY